MLRALHIILAIQVLFSSTGVVIFEHVCQKKGSTTALFEKSRNCCLPLEYTKHPCQKSKCCQAKEINSGTSVSKKPCCEDQSQFLKLGTENTAFKTFTFADLHLQPVWVTAALAVEHLDVNPFNQKTLRFYLYKPPPVVTDLRVLMQSFLC